MNPLDVRMLAEQAFWDFGPKFGSPDYEKALAYMASINQAADAYVASPATSKPVAAPSASTPRSHLPPSSQVDVKEVEIQV